MRGDLIETFKIICGISNYGINFFKIFSHKLNLLSRQMLKIKSTKQVKFLG